MSNICREIGRPVRSDAVVRHRARGLEFDALGPRVRARNQRDGKVRVIPVKEAQRRELSHGLR
jgi:hypothetical protein